jgi:hypothetical protein
MLSCSHRVTEAGKRSAGPAFAVRETNFLSQKTILRKGGEAHNKGRYSRLEEWFRCTK